MHASLIETLKQLRRKKVKKRHKKLYIYQNNQISILYYIYRPHKS